MDPDAGHIEQRADRRAQRFVVVERASLPDCLRITAETEDGLIMGLVHRELPIHGVQFHPESIASESGKPLLRNFLELAGAALETA